MAAPTNKTVPALRLLSTDFDGTLFAEFENPPVPLHLQQLIARMQANGTVWAINTGRDLSSLMEAMARSHLTVKPDYLVLVEREIYVHNGVQYTELPGWNENCNRQHQELFAKVKLDVPRLNAWVNRHYPSTTIYEDAWSPFCLIAENNGHMDEICAYLESYCAQIPHLVVVRNDVYARFSHDAYNKGSALLEIGGRLKISPPEILAAGDHYNDLPMLRTEIAGRLVCPSNAIPRVKDLVLRQGGFCSDLKCGHGTAAGLEHYLAQLGA